MLSLLLLALPLSAAATQMQAILHNTHRGDNYHYPTDLTRGILPIPVHSHNDYWRDIPFYTGLSNGCMSTEADVWLYNDTLYVGHDESSLTHERTLESLYINPILDVLERQNPQTPFVTSPTKNGVFDTDTAQTLYFFIDVKTSGPETFQAVISALEPLRQQGYLTTLKNNKTLTTGPVTIIGTGDTPLSMVGPVEDRDYFYDAKLESLDEPENAAITSLISPIASTSFKDAVGTVNLGLPTGVKLTIRHVSSTPTPCAALYAAPPGEEPEPTFCENHFLSVSVPVESDESGTADLIVFGIEVLVYSAAHLTTIFVSKADSTGYLDQLKKVAPKASLLRRISHTFLAYLVRTRQRPGVRLLLSLFARAQNQYLFPGSIENPNKHVLDDRGLIKWWCRAVDPILREYEPESGSDEKGVLESARNSATAFLIVPGCDRFETRGFFPPTAKSDDKDRPRWLNSYPLKQLCDNPRAPPRCLVPRFPDDPKTRFLTDLDDELPRTAQSGQWRSVRSLDQFWEMMSFRQECSAGRLVGFLWLVINPPGMVNSVQMTSSRPMPIETASATAPSTGDKSQSTELTPADSHPVPPQPSQTPPSELPHDSSKPTKDPSPTAEKPPQAPTTTTETNPFFWPAEGRGHAVLSEEDYKTAINFLLDQDFFNEEVSIASSKAWADKVASLTDELWVGQQVVGKQTPTTAADSESVVPGAPTPTAEPSGNVLAQGLVRKRKKVEDAPPSSSPPPPQPSASSAASEVNVLQGNLIRKKKKKT
ncbi:uncharacterized protein BDW47DRAFT_118187 [Aspergillus candidus]|uniref:histone acetyltransferase n=1 Tax=Aspergillus candidus TaxID=41067 RepID=A0A2I2F9Q0_ASPCN|nr:hypothetical protein BDW47DRAFT_118187 [Aspergillus candidus]PLB37349.1 hypothetical protein BDW47DRAFT_118187 [Aspergillus candidus]